MPLAVFSRGNGVLRLGKVIGDARQRARTSRPIHNIREQISHPSQMMTLKPGDILATGTPSGVGVAKVPPAFLPPGDVMRVVIPGPGHSENRVVTEAQPVGAGVSPSAPAIVGSRPLPLPGRRPEAPRTCSGNAR
ncbi:hypothetical protein HL658_34255 [Azospirillum sp. RWY-5-1]|uniref:Fumarylacetoacetase-like C-terminal domain-containing protein n=1 Tax=Azospirillum oleiclasticum TaxID=2735135 RepID=A0ABX2TKS9_9PROT|nr:fumarylacetoacetate hydrolase family protein [Azospirillum oleiclasticum]NYZ17634.1 hypothetical protein [Azospirillum oleiclasticum]NYZ24898.1 hypothetical protein [Azospirillum oleiclasticum]